MLGPDVLAAGSVVAMLLGVFLVARWTRLGAGFPASFGEGFLPFRPDGWPRGVQEDDDAHWSWPDRGPVESSRLPSPSAIRRRATPPRHPQRHAQR
jgi:hypothetical protein